MIDERRQEIERGIGILRERGTAWAEWASENGFSRQAVSAVVNGKTKALRGVRFRVAEALRGIGLDAGSMAPDAGRSCRHCDGPGGRVTYAHQVCMPINGKVHCIDRCIHQIVAALNAGGVQTVASCCGHGAMPGRIDLEDGRTLVIAGGSDQVAAVWAALGSGTDGGSALPTGEAP